MVDEPEFAFWLVLPARTTCVVFEDLPHLLAQARWGDPDFSSAANGSAYGLARVQFEDDLPREVRDGRLVVRNPLTLQEQRLPVGAVLQMSVVSVSDLGAFLAERGIGIRTRKRFVTLPRPRVIDPELLDLDPREVIETEQRYGGLNSSSLEPAGPYIESVRERIERQACGWFEVAEAAQVIADANPGIDAASFAERLRAAVLDGRTLLRNQSDKLRIADPKNLRDWHALIKDSDVSAWLLAEGAGYRFPESDGTADFASAFKLSKSSLTVEAEWFQLAKDAAAAIIKRQAALNLFPSQIAVADEIARDFRRRTPPVHGADGTPLTGATIKRHALKGISSATKKSRVTHINRGK